MTRNRTAIDVFSAIGTELMVVLLLVLAMGLRFLGTSRSLAIACGASR